MTPKNYLNEIRKINTRIKHLEAELTDLENDAVSITGMNYLGDRARSSPDGDARYVRLLVRADEIRSEIYKEKTMRMERRHQITEMIDRVDNPTFASLLEMRYVRGWPFDKIARELEYSYKHTLRMHGWALRAFEEVLKNAGDNYVLNSGECGLDGSGSDDGGSDCIGDPGSPEREKKGD